MVGDVVLPHLLHPIRVTISPVDKTSTTYDDDAREPIREVVKKTPIVVMAQNRVRRLAEPEMRAMGIVEDVRGWLTLRKAELDAASYVPKRGDLVTLLGHRQTQVYVVWWEDMAHYGDQNGATLMRLYYSERRPSASAPSMG